MGVRQSMYIYIIWLVAAGGDRIDDPMEDETLEDGFPSSTPSPVRPRTLAAAPSLALHCPFTALHCPLTALCA